MCGACLVQVDLVKDSGQQYFIQYLDSNDSTSSTDSRAQAAFVLAVICDKHPRGQSLCAGAGLLGVCLSHLRQSMTSLQHGSARPLLLIKWLCLCLGKLCEDMPEVTATSVHLVFFVQCLFMVVSYSAVHMTFLSTL